MDDYIQEFTERFRAALDRSGLASLRELARVSGCKFGQIRKINAGEFSQYGPGIKAVQMCAKAMNVPLTSLIPSGYARPGINEFLSRREGFTTHISAFSDIIKYCDIYEKPRCGKTHISGVGQNSYLCERSGISDPGILQAQYESWNIAKKREVYERQKSAWDKGYFIDAETFDQRFQSTSKHVTQPIVLAACRVRRCEGGDALIVYCEPLGQKG